MNTNNRERTLQWICNQYEKGNISFDHKLQRPINQWNNKMKSLLIHSLLSGYPINPIYVINQDNVIYTLDGSQRTSTCIDYVNNVFALSKNTPPITIMSNENGEQITKTYEIAGKKFKKLDEEVQSTLLSCGLQFCTISDYTDEEIKELFRRQNTCKPLNGKQLRIVEESDEFSDVIYSLSHHPFMDKIVTKSHRKNGTDRDLIIQTLMLIMCNHEKDFTSFRNNDIDAFVRDYGDESISLASTLKEAMDSLDKNFDEIKINVTTIPMILFSAYRVQKDKKSFEKLVQKINEFLDGYDQNEEYKQYSTYGTSSSDKVRWRFDYWRNIVKEISR